MANITVGSFITGKANSDYMYTTDAGLFYVQSVNADGDITIITIARTDAMATELEYPYTVDPSQFEIVADPALWIRNKATVYMTREDFERKYVPKVEGDGKVEEEKGEREMEAKELVFNKEDLIAEATQLLVHGFNDEEFGYGVSDYGLGKIMDVWHKNKEPLEKILARHPNFIPEKHYIALPKQSFKRTIDKKQIKKFCSWAVEHMDKPQEKYLAPWSYAEADDYCDHLRGLVDRMNDLERYRRHWDDPKNVVVVNGKSRADWNADLAYFVGVKSLYSKNDGIIVKNCHAYDRKEYETYSYRKLFFTDFADIIAYNDEVSEGKATEQVANALNKDAEKCGVELNAVAGQKLSRIVGKFCKAIGLDKVVDTGTTYSGREKDFGYNYQFALFADAINVLTFDQTLVISVNPIDYWTMSFGHSWQSCHTIDKWGKRRASHEDDAHNYSGMYSSGTESYMLDETSIIVYTVDPKYDGGSLMNLEKADKMKRCVFCFGKEKLIQSRVYPDGRNNSEEGITDNSFATELRNAIQKVFADCLGVPNSWILRNGTMACDAVTYSYGTHYKDYLHYSDCNVSFLKREDGTKNEEPISIGHNPICPNCGEEHDEEDNICCPGCQEDGKVQCASCGEWIDPDGDDVIYCEDNGNYYCDEDCADNDGIHYCTDDCNYHSEGNCYQDARTFDWFYNTDEMVTTEDGNHYQNPESAENDGYAETSEGEWYPESEVHYCEHCEQYVHESNWNDELGCCIDCEDEVREEREDEDVRTA